MIKVAYLWISVFLIACGGSRSEPTQEKITTQTDVKVDIPSRVECSLEQLVGTWEYTEARVDPKMAGIKPMGGTVLMGITKDGKMAFATAGVEELTQNLDFIPSDFSIIDNEICASDSNDITFKINFQRNCIPVFLVNENELILGKGKDSFHPENPAVYQYYNRVK